MATKNKGPRKRSPYGLGKRPPKSFRKWLRSLSRSEIRELREEMYLRRQERRVKLDSYEP
jgi:hypothetical protein